MDDNFPGACGKAAVPLSDRERKLLEAARDARATLGDITLCSFPNLDAAIRAYDQPRKQYTMPSWEEFDFTEEKIIWLRTIAHRLASNPDIHHLRDMYNFWREALTTEEQ